MSKKENKGVSEGEMRIENWVEVGLEEEEEENMKTSEGGWECGGK